LIVRVGKFLAYFLLTVVALCAVAGVALYARLAQGPVALSFLAPTVQNKINANLSGVQVRIADVIIEREAGSGRPNLRLKEITLTDRTGTVIARAPRATIGVDGAALFTGQVVPTRLELIGARILVQRRRDGSFQLGFADTDLAGESKSGATEQPGAADQPADAQPPEAVPQKAIAPAEQTSEVEADSMLDFLNQELVDAKSGAVARIDAVEVSRASITFYDEPSRSVWFAPQANLVFKRAPYGFALFADAQIASGAQPWRTEIAATYRANSESFNLSARIFDLVPAEIADDVFALSRLAQVKLPLSGHAEVEFTRKGVLTAATAELTAAAGRVGFPGYIADPILIDEGLIIRCRAASIPTATSRASYAASSSGLRRAASMGPAAKRWRSTVSTWSALPRSRRRGSISTTSS
jgi:hypothetical protein